MSSTVPLGPKLVNVLNLPCQFLLARFRGANLCWMADLTFDSQLSRQVQKPVHRPGRFNAHAHRARKFGIKLPHAVTFVEQSCIHDLPGGGIQHRQGLLASVQIASYNSHSASFGPSAVRVNTETVYSGRSEADLVMASTGQMESQYGLGACSAILSARARVHNFSRNRLLAFNSQGAPLSHVR